MILLRSREMSGLARVVAIFGAGRIGLALAGRIAVRLDLEGEVLPLDWSSRGGQVRDLGAIARSIERELERPGGRLDVVWSAGRARFAATESETALELESFERVFGTVRALASNVPGTKPRFHLVSSAGGLFEGQRGVEPDTRPAPRRPYGRLKLRQERLLLDGTGIDGRRIYRLTAVYGPILPYEGKGLIETLGYNALTHRTTSIYGTPSTLRDFVWRDDVVRFLADAIADSGTRCEAVATLASARPASILEIQRMIESGLRRRAYLVFSTSRADRADITYSPALAPPGWRPADLSSTVHRICREALGGRRDRPWGSRGSANLDRPPPNGGTPWISTLR